jgi:1,4-dihydroxy-2-naphthoate octaprenyltransferase
MSTLSLLLGVTRTSFVILAPACAFVGIATARWSGATPDALSVILVLLAATAGHVSVNALNEYHDFKTGLDFNTRRTPFSGGSGVLPANPEKAPVALIVGLVSLGIASAIGFYFIAQQGWGLLPLGLLGAILALTYTVWISRSAFLTLLAPGLGFGHVIVLGAHFALTGAYTWTAFIASLVPFFLVSNLLLINQFPDREADRAVGRRNYIIVAGGKTGAIIYDLFLLGAYLAIIAGVLLGHLPATALLGLGTLVFAVPTAIGVLRHAEADIERLIPYLALNVLINLFTPILLGVGLLIA